MMEWIKNLPEVGTPLLNRLRRIEELEERADALQKEAIAIRQKAYLECLSLDGAVQAKWTPEEIKKARAAITVPS